MADAGTLKINILADVAEFNKSLEKIAGDLKNIGTKVTAFGLAVGAGLGFAVKAAGESEAATGQLTVALRNQGQYTDELREKILSFSSALQEQTGYSDEAITGVQSSLIAYGLQGEALERVTKAALDLSRAQGVDLTSSALLLGRAFTGETSMLSRYGISIDQNLPKTEKFGAALKLIEGMYGGSAAEYRKTFLGQLDAMKEKFGDLAQDIGFALLPYLREFVAWADTMVTKFRALDPAVIQTGAKIAALAAAGSLVLGPLLVLAGTLPSIIAGFKAMGIFAALLGTSFGGILVPIAGLVYAVGLWISRWDELRESSKVLLNYVLIDGLNAVMVKANGVIAWINEKVIPIIQKIPGIGEIATIPLLGQLEHVKFVVENTASDAVTSVQKAGDKAGKALDKDIKNMGKDVKGLGGLISKQAMQMEKDEADRKARAIAAADAHYASLFAAAANHEAMVSALRKFFTAEDVTLVMNSLNQKAQLDLLAKMKQLEEEGKFNEAKLLQIQTVNDAIDAREEKLKQARQERAQNFVSTLNYISSLADSKNRWLAGIGKAAAISTATIDTYAAANKALKSAPPPWNFALMGAVIAAGLANVAKIVGIRLAEGGIVMPRSGGVTATVAEAGSPEAVIPLKGSKAKRMLGDALGGGGSNITVQISGQFLEADSTKWQRLVREYLVPEIRRFTDISPKGPFTRRRGRTV